MDVHCTSERFKLIGRDELPNYKRNIHYPALHPQLVPRFRETECQLQTFRCMGRRFGNVLMVQFALAPDSKRFIELNKGWKLFKKLAHKNHKDPSKVRAIAKKRCLVARDDPKAERTSSDLVFHGIDVVFEPVTTELALLVQFDVFFFASNTFATFVALYIPVVDELAVLDSNYNRELYEQKKVSLTGEFRSELFEKIKRISAHRVTNHEFVLSP